MLPTDKNRTVSRTIRELGGEIWAELQKVPDERIRWDAKNEVVDIIMMVLARYEGAIIKNDEGLRVATVLEKRKK